MFLPRYLILFWVLTFINLSIAQSLPWGDDFDDGNMDGWTIIDDEPYTSGPSNWYVLNGELNQASNIFTTLNEYDVFKGTHIVSGNPNWSDYYFVVRITSSDDDGIGMLFRYQDANNYYRFLTVQDPGNRGPFKRLEKQISGQFTTLAESTTGIKIPGHFVGKVHVAGDSIYVFENNELLFAVQDNTFNRGKIGLMCYANTGAIFDDVYVSQQDTVYQDKQETLPDILTAERELSVRVFTYNIWVNGKICTPTQIANLIQSLDLDLAGLQECNFDFGNQVATLLGWHMAKGSDCVLLSRTPYTKVKNLPVSGINAWTNIDSQTVSVYNFHIPWDEAGDRAARTMVDELFTNDPVPLQIAFGDFNDEHYSTQITIIEEHMRYCLADLGWAPSQRVTWPAFDFYGSEGAQTIDLIFCNKESKGRAIEGEIMNLSPILSDHKPVWATIKFPARKEEVGPQITKVLPYFGTNMIEVWFDQDLDAESVSNTANYLITPVDGGASVSVTQADLLKDVRRVRLLTSPHDYEKKYQISVSGLLDTFGVPAMPDAKMEYVVRKNLLENPDAENGVEYWQPFGGFTAVSERENQTPYLGNHFFTGENMQDLSTGTQTVDLTPWAEDIDTGMLVTVWNCHFATGYEVLGEIRASRCEPYDEGEMLIDFVDENGEILLQASSKRWDTLYWHPYGEITVIPPGTRRAVVHLSSYRKTPNGPSNDACFENAFFAVKKLAQPHPYGKNLLANPSAETGDLSGWTVEGSLRARAHQDNKARPVSGYYMFSNAGVGTAEAFQIFDLSDHSTQIDADDFAVKWGGYMRDFRGDSYGQIKVEFYDRDNKYIGYASTGRQRVAEWWFYDTETMVPATTRQIKYVISLEAVDNEGVYFDFLHFIPVTKTTTQVITQNGAINDFKLEQNYPNPFTGGGRSSLGGNHGTIIPFSLKNSTRATLTIYNIRGEKVKQFHFTKQPSGHHRVNWLGDDDFGQPVSSGVYFYQLSLGAEKSAMKKLVLIR